MHNHCLVYILVIMLGLLKVYVCLKPDICLAKDYEEDPIDYCKEPDQPHIACNNSNAWDKACGKNPEIIPITNRIQKFIVRQHNVYRNIVAKGTMNGLPPAARMLSMKWDENLADVAEYAVKLCSIEPLKKSFSTILASKPGFNAVYNKYPKHEIQREMAILNSHMKAWYEEYIYVSIERLQSEKIPLRQEISHFLQVMIGPNDKVGCAMVKFQKDMWKHQLMICLYGCYKKTDQLAYTIGKTPAEKCECGSHMKFKNLCEHEETHGDCALFEESEDEAIDITRKSTTQKPIKKQKPGPQGGLTNIYNWLAERMGTEQKPQKF